MSDLTLKLGSFQFEGLEIPESLPFGGSQRLAVHDLVGGTRVIDSMGAFTGPIEWSGWLLGETAMDRARALDDLRQQGNDLLLKWHEIAYQVVIREFRADFQRFYKIPYHITCEVVSDLSKFAGNDDDQSIDGQMTEDAATATELSDSVGDSTLSGLMDSVNSAINAVSDFATAAQSTINSVLQPIAALRTQVQTMISSANNTLMNVTTLGGILPNNPISQQVSKLSGQIVAATNLPVLVQLDRVAGRMQGNLDSIYSSAKQVTVAGGNLMNMAAKEWNDAMAWTGIAKANPQLNGDPQIVGIQTVTIPPNQDSVGGVLNA